MTKMAKKFANFAKMAKMVTQLMASMEKMVKTGGENGKSDPKKVKVARRKCESRNVDRTKCESGPKKM